MIFRAGLVALLGAVACVCADAQFTQQGSKLIGTGAGNADPGQGWSAALSADGNTAIVGGIFDNHTRGASWVFTRTAGVWSQQGNKLLGAGAFDDVAYQGYAVALSADGNTALVGADDDSNEVGAAWVFVRTGSTWAQQGNKLVGTNGIEIVYQGTSVSLSADGNTALIGGPRDNNFVGAVWVFKRSGGAWSQEGNKVLCTGSAGSSQFGQSASLSGDGNTAVVGGPKDNAGTGAVWVFVRNAGVWSQQGSKWTATGAVGSPSLGVSAAISGDGNTAVIGGSDDNGGLGAAWVFVRNGNTWSQQGSRLVGTGAVGSANQGSSVSITSDGNTILVGGEADNNGAGAAWVYTRTGGVWAQNGNKIVGTGAAGPAHQGKAVAISADGYTAAVGGDTDNSGGGAAWMFNRATLPIQLSQFNAQVSGGREVDIEWTTASETNNYGFQVERSGGGSSDFEDLTGGFLPGHGTTLEMHRYKVTDVPPSRGLWRYRLRQIDLDGAVTHTDAEQIEITGGTDGVSVPADFSLAQNYPDPFNPSTTIGVGVPRESFVSIDVYNVLGQRVAQPVHQILEAGYHTFLFDASDLASGAYLYRMTAGNFVSTRRFLVIR